MDLIDSFHLEDSNVSVKATKIKSFKQRMLLLFQVIPELLIFDFILVAVAIVRVIWDVHYLLKVLF